MDGDFKGFSVVLLGIRSIVHEGNIIVMMLASSQLSALGQYLGVFVPVSQRNGHKRAPALFPVYEGNGGSKIQPAKFVVKIRIK